MSSTIYGTSIISDDEPVSWFEESAFQETDAKDTNAMINKVMILCLAGAVWYYFQQRRYLQCLMSEKYSKTQQDQTIPLEFYNKDVKFCSSNRTFHTIRPSRIRKAFSGMINRVSSSTYSFPKIDFNDDPEKILSTIGSKLYETSFGSQKLKTELDHCAIDQTARKLWEVIRPENKYENLVNFKQYLLSYEKEFEEVEQKKVCQLTQLLHFQKPRGLKDLQRQFWDITNMHYLVFVPAHVCVDMLFICAWREMGWLEEKIRYTARENDDADIIHLIYSLDCFEFDRPREFSEMIESEKEESEEQKCINDIETTWGTLLQDSSDYDDGLEIVHTISCDSEENLVPSMSIVSEMEQVE
ncbi:hypothetical protein DASC09_053860 [Saccharomycopsis crataegensis]|uniref:Uncharacterized protein n=1 Tax=Saccharomycopsis crataegensis TaxID=43959 RepID=A0AAV5QU73_9ASCO|nr:hypothetical protein DASC09_053860 [Saccharomycopsis crataegensis]